MFRSVRVHSVFLLVLGVAVATNHAAAVTSGPEAQQDAARPDGRRASDATANRPGPAGPAAESHIVDIDRSGRTVDFTETAPGTWNGNSCSGNDCNLRVSEDVTYKIIIPQDGTWTFSLCGSSYDTYLFLGTGECQEDVGSDDDFCDGGPQSEITRVLEAGTYYLAVEGFSPTHCGVYVLTITGSCICGDGTCEPACGESCETCTADCGPDPCPCGATVDTYPHCTGFETGFGAWVQGACADIDWLRVSNAFTHTNGTGPQNAHTDSFYVYTESSGTGNPDKVAVLEACFDLSELPNPELNFWYHMFGFTMGSLGVEISDDSCGTWNELWSLSGNQLDEWHEATVDLSDYSGSTVTIRFFGTTGTGITSDMALDDICVRAGPSFCPDGSSMIFAKSGMTDAGQPHPIDNSATAQGYRVFTAVGPTGAADPACWRFSETDAGGCGNFIAGVVETSAGEYEITLDRPLQSRSVTTITYDWGAGSVSGSYTALPGDANGSGQTGTADLGALISCLNNEPCDLWKCDTDRLGGCTGADLTRLIDLLNPAGAFTSWNLATPAVTPCP